VTAEVRFEGANKRLMNRWLGRQILYRRQGRGDIGARMARAFREAFNDGTERAALVGTDCPGITPEILNETFEALGRNDVVLGPATDGGYYLIGLHRPTPELFVNLPWGTREVMERTLQIAKERGLRVHAVKTLGDVDKPEDIHIWRDEELRFRSESCKERISVIIPTLNEASNLAETLAKIRTVEEIEVIVADGGSHDGTMEIARSLGVKVIETDTGRATQMNAGAAAATGNILLFLHADTRLPDNFTEHVRQMLEQRGTAGGAFQLSIDAPGWFLRLIERGANWRSTFLQMPYGDQAFFLRADLFREMGGFPDVPIMEDLEFVRRLRERGAIVIAPVPVVTSARRWLMLGSWRTTLTNQGALAAYYAGVPLLTIARWYNKKARPASSSDKD
jgi:rSAM/selenodomain-associated transferase 2/rSAM/selenodomain-associated transferase 1